MFPVTPTLRPHLDRPIRGLSAYDEVMVEELKMNGINVQHILTTVRTDANSSPSTRSIAMKLKFNNITEVDINILEVRIDARVYYSGSIMNPFLNKNRPSKVMHSCGFTIGDDATLEEVLSSLIDELEFRFKEH